ncbi:MAG: DUF4349 domain-containing protein [Candidatus Saganbacteria bacterium]|nr:DUF4349 domain-containing protein [Candidatus Saganbacteria bacterium]
MFKKILALGLVVLVIALSGCSLVKKFKTSGTEVTYEALEVAGKDRSFMAAREGMADAKTEVITIPAENLNERKLIYSAFLEIEVKDVVKTMEGLEAIAKQNDGYVGTSSIKKYENQSKSGQAILRIPSKNLDVALAEIKLLGDVRDESKSSSDITKEYYDLEARLLNARAFEKRILKLLQTRTTKIADVLDVEKELARVRGNIETMQGSLKYYQNQVALSTISVRLYEKGVALPAKTDWLQSIIDTFVSAGTAFAASIGEIIIIAFALAPWVVFLGIIIFVVVRIWKKARKPKA